MAGATDQVNALLARDPAAHADIGKPNATARLLDALRAAGAADQVAVLLARDPAAHADLRIPSSTAHLVEALRAAGAADQAAALISRERLRCPSGLLVPLDSGSGTRILRPGLRPAPLSAL